MAVKKQSQSEKFIAKAKELGADESGKAFERAFKKVVPAKKPPNVKSPCFPEPSDKGKVQQ